MSHVTCLTYLVLHLMYPVLSLLSHVSCHIFPVSLSCLTHVSCHPHVSCLTSPVSHLLSHVSCLMSPVSSFLSPVSHLLSHVSCPTSPVSRLLSHIYCLTSPVPRFLSHDKCLSELVAQLAKWPWMVFIFTKCVKNTKIVRKVRQEECLKCKTFPQLTPEGVPKYQNCPQLPPERVLQKTKTSKVNHKKKCNKFP